MGRKKLDSKKEKKVAQPRPAYVMPPPNDDAAAYGWALGKLRYRDPAAHPKDKDPWPGPYVFAVPTDLATRQVYGHSIDFVNTGYLQLVLDAQPEIREGAEKVKAAGYTPEALEQFAKIVRRVFREKVLPEIATRFDAVTDLVAQFYAARLAHIDKFGFED